MEGLLVVREDRRGKLQFNRITNWGQIASGLLETPTESDQLHLPSPSLPSSWGRSGHVSLIALAPKLPCPFPSMPLADTPGEWAIFRQLMGSLQRTIHQIRVIAANCPLRFSGLRPGMNRPFGRAGGHRRPRFSTTPTEALSWLWVSPVLWSMEFYPCMSFLHLIIPNSHKSTTVAYSFTSVLNSQITTS